MTWNGTALIVVLMLAGGGIVSCQEPAPADKSMKYEEIFFEWVSTGSCCRARRNIEAVMEDLNKSRPSDEVSGVLRVLERDGRPPEGLVIPRLDLVVDEKFLRGAIKETYVRLWKVVFLVNPAKRAEIEKALNARITAKGRDVEPKAYEILAMVGKEDTTKAITQFFMAELKDADSKFRLVAVMMLGYLGVQEARPELDKVIETEEPKSQVRQYAFTAKYRLKLLSVDQWQERLISAVEDHEGQYPSDEFGVCRWAMQTLLRKGCKSERFLQVVRRWLDAEETKLTKGSITVSDWPRAKEDYLVVLKELGGTISADEEGYLKEMGYTD